ncbi:cyanophycin synthetase [Piscinibacter sp. XHJ-5]|uniref:cyanophycin synthetase n=1 Tax=Piscinibacter sp. XHJ-5 TaxID=3037797 RepID=UPI0024531CD5|nr:cyanophycin synthetase [Piscinibacter sp. XHJ-5]
MKVIERRFLRGPNLHALRPCFLAVLDLEDLDEVPSTALPGFTERLVELLPGLVEHRCSVGRRGGFVERLREGTYMAHIVEHVTLALQNLAGHDLGFGKARMVQGMPRQYRVVVEYLSERLVRHALDIAVELVSRLAGGRPFELEAAVAQLRQIASREALGPSTRAIVEAARRRGIPTVRLADEAHLFQLGWGVRQHRIQATTTSRTNYVAVEIASDKQLTKALLAEAGLPVPEGRTVATMQDASEAARAIGRPVVVKPLDANQGKGVSTAVDNEPALAAAFERARAHGEQVIVEEHLEGDDYRVLVVDGRVVAAARRLPPRVKGDGRSTVRELVERENADPARGHGHENVLTRIPLDALAEEALAQQALQVDSVPGEGRIVRLRGNANLSTGGTAEDVSAEMHPDTGRACVRAARKIGLDIAGIDLVCRDIRRPLAEQRGAIIEVNAAPGIRMHEHPSQGRPHPVGEAIVESLFPNSTDGRIPVVAITGSNGKTTTTLAVAHVLQRLGRCTGVTTTEGVFVGGQQVSEGDCTGYWSARAVLSSPEVEVAVLETARGGILKRGLGFDRCDVAVVLNVQRDHLGNDGVETLDDLAEVKGLVVEVARKAVVLNAQDERCVAMAARAPRGCEVIYFAQDRSHPVFARHLQQGGRGVHVQQGIVMLGHGEHDMPLVDVTRLPFTLQGLARHNVENALAAFAALLALDIAGDSIGAAMASFTSSAHQNPLRLNVFRSCGITLLVDYAHNAAAYRAIIATARGLTAQRVIGVATAPGDRRDDDLAEIGQVCADGFDDVVFYEMDEFRGRAPGATAQQLERGATQARAPWRTVLDVREAIREAMRRARPGDVVVLGCASHLDEVRDALGHADIAAVDLGALGAAQLSPDAVSAFAEESTAA